MLNKEKENSERKPRPLAHLAIYAKVLKIFHKLPKGKILDVPAGEGALSLELLEKDYEVSACDLYPQIFCLDEVEIKQGNLDCKLPYANGSFDYVVCIEGLEHIENPSNAINQFCRVLKNGGYLVISVPNIMNIEERLK